MKFEMGFLQNNWNCLYMCWYLVWNVGMLFQSVDILFRVLVSYFRVLNSCLDCWYLVLACLLQNRMIIQNDYNKDGLFYFVSKPQLLLYLIIKLFFKHFFHMSYYQVIGIYLNIPVVTYRVIIQSNKICIDICTVVIQSFRSICCNFQDSNLIQSRRSYLIKMKISGVTCRVVIWFKLREWTSLVECTVTCRVKTSVKQKLCAVTCRVVIQFSQK